MMGVDYDVEAETMPASRVCVLILFLPGSPTLSFCPGATHDVESFGWCHHQDQGHWGEELTGKD